MILLSAVVSALIGTSVSGVLVGTALCPTDVVSAGYEPSAFGSLDIAHRKLAIRRAKRIAHLHDYADRERFPLNTDFPDDFVPYFVDEIGTACAVGHLMRLDGKRDLVACIASSTNHIRIENVHDGPLLEWILESGLTQDECALIQPTYAQIEDYRRGPAWQDEIARLQKHFAKVEQTLCGQSQLSLRKALIAKVDAQLAKNPNDPALSVDALSTALRSNEPNVRIAAAYAMAQLSELGRGARLTALEPNLSDADLAVKFWTAVAVENIIGSDSPSLPRHERLVTRCMELHHRALPIFVKATKSSEQGMRLAALLQLANAAPMTIGTHKQFRIMPEIRRTMVLACDDDDREIRQFARRVLTSWRWQRVAYESQRISRQYLADSAELEALAAEALALGRKYLEPRDPLATIGEPGRNTDGRVHYRFPGGHESPVPIADSTAEAKRIVDAPLKTFYQSNSDRIKSNTAPRPPYKIASVNRQVLHYTVVVSYNYGLKLTHIVPRPGMLAKANIHPYYWFNGIKEPVSDGRSGLHRWVWRPKRDVDVTLGNLARNNREAFTTTCDLIAHFSSPQLVLDREVEELPDTLVWSGRFATLRRSNPRFFGEGVGSSTFGGGGWDFRRIELECNRKTGQLTISTELIEFPIVPLPPSALHAELVKQEQKLMGWKPLSSLDFFGDRSFPPEYHQAIDAFNPANDRASRNLFQDRYYLERNLPHPKFMLGLLHERAGQRELAVVRMNDAASRQRHDPSILADVGRWEFDVGMYDDARKHAEAALQIWGNHPGAKKLVGQLDKVSDHTVLNSG